MNECEPLLPGVTDTRVGYTGGVMPSPTYGSVCGGDGHTEVGRCSLHPFPFHLHCQSFRSVPETSSVELKISQMPSVLHSTRSISYYRW